MSAADLHLAMMLGSEVRDGYLVLDKDCIEIERELRRAIKQVRRMRGKRVVVAGDRIITAFHVTEKKEEQRLLRRLARSGRQAPPVARARLPTVPSTIVTGDSP
jgi:hypothetical protein